MNVATTMKLKKNLFFLCLFCFLALQARAQWTVKDSVNLKKILESDGEIKLNSNALKMLGKSLYGEPGMVLDKSWMQYDLTLPTTPFADKEEEVEDKHPLKISLNPYNANTKYNYDPVYKKTIRVSNAYHGDLSSLTRRNAPGTTRGNNAHFMLMGGGISGGFNCDFAYISSKKFWNFRAKKARKRTLEVLEQYSDSAQLYLNVKKRDLK
ncbi:MAG: hypothetical protein H6Q13_1599 [Bacteroidetes bacterium]|jgi:hypothetical protein|nr:hypothetical protein [Bacteroidota bacterium]